MGSRRKWTEDLYDSPQEPRVHMAEVPRSLIPDQVPPWNMTPSDMSLPTKAALRFGNEGPRKLERWRPR